MQVRRLLYRSNFLFAILLFAAGCSDIRQRSIPMTDVEQKEKPSIEAIHKWTMMPYSQFEKEYCPKIVPLGKKFEGVSSWYGPDFHGNRTSSGEVYDMYGMTAAHKTFPMNTVIKVTNKKNAKEVIVRVNDRGPFVDERIVDLSFAAGKEIGLDRTGIAEVELEVLGYDDFISALLEKEEPKSQKEKSFFVQIGSFRNEKSAQKVKESAAFVYEDRDIKIKSANIENNPIYKVYVSGFKDESEARGFIQKNSIDGAFIVSEN